MRPRVRLRRGYEAAFNRNARREDAAKLDPAGRGDRRLHQDQRAWPHRRPRAPGRAGHDLVTEPGSAGRPVGLLRQSARGAPDDLLCRPHRHRCRRAGASGLPGYQPGPALGRGLAARPYGPQAEQRGSSRGVGVNRYPATRSTWPRRAACAISWLRRRLLRLWSA